jgi:hypothetical protein
MRENWHILGGNCGGGTGPKITNERDKNKDDKHPNTLISFKRGINIRGGKKDDFSFPQKLVAALAVATHPFLRRNLTKPVCMPFLLSV